MFGMDPEYRKSVTTGNKEKEVCVYKAENGYIIKMMERELPNIFDNDDEPKEYKMPEIKWMISRNNPMAGMDSQVKDETSKFLDELESSILL